MRKKITLDKINLIAYYVLILFLLVEDCIKFSIDIIFYPFIVVFLEFLFKYSKKLFYKIFYLEGKNEKIK